MTNVSRRKFIAGSAAAAAGGAIGAKPLRQALKGSEPGASAVGPAMAADDAVDENDTDGVGTMVYVRDAAKGEVVIMGDSGEIVVTDKKLVARLAQASRKGREA
jgi:hypothetical protein